MSRPLLLTLACLCLALPACSHDSSLHARLAGAEQLARDAEDDLKEADHRIKADQIDKASDLLKDAREKVEDRQMLYWADRENLEDRISQAESRVAAAKEDKLRREIASQIPERKEKGEQAMVEFREAADALQDRATLNRKKSDRARQALDGASHFFDDSKRFEIDATWQAFAQAARKELAGRTVQVTQAEALLGFLEGPVAASAQAKASFEKVKTAKTHDEKTVLLTAARDGYLACGRDAAALVAQVPTLEREAIAVAGAKPTTVKAFAAACETQAKSVDAILNPGAAAAKPGKPAPAAAKKK